MFALAVVHDVVHHGMDVLVLHGRQIDPPHIAMYPDHWWESGREVKVGRFVLDGEGEQFSDVHGRLVLLSGGKDDYRPGDILLRPDRLYSSQYDKNRRELASRNGAYRRGCLGRGRLPDDVALLAVSKTWPAECVAEAAACGQRAFGENYVQEAVDKIAALAGLGLEWHFIGPIQSNKTRPLAEHFDWVHSVDRFRVAARLSAQRPCRWAPERLPAGQCERRGQQERGLAGRPPALAEAVAALPRLRLRGLMCIPEPTDDVVCCEAASRCCAS